MTEELEVIEYSIKDKLLNMPLFKASCSSIGKIVGESRGKTIKQKIADCENLIEETAAKLANAKEGSKTKDNLLTKIAKLQSDIKVLIDSQKDEIKLSETAKTYCEHWLKRQLYERRKDFKSKYTEKGNEMEAPAIDYCERVFEGSDGWFLAKKNSERKANLWIEGECDIELTEAIIDIKNSWDFSTFPLFDKEIPTIDYYWQLQGYMWLWEKEKGSICYVLMSMPEELIIQEARWKMGYNYTQQQYEDFAMQYKYDHFPRDLRIKEYRFDRDEEKLDLIKTKVIECRKYIEILVQDLLNNLKD